jgi:GH15 family glucan-1,4-alpha-glucosidase
VALRIEDYALIGDTQTAALAGRDGSIDWLCFPRFDSGACFAALLGSDANGRWLIAPDGAITHTTRRYRGESLVLETEFHTASGAVRIVDCMPVRGAEPDLVRVVEGLRGEVAMRMELIVRFDYGAIVPWARRVGDGLRFIGGPDAVTLWSPVETHGEGLTTVARFDVAAGQAFPFVLAWHPSHLEPHTIDARQAVGDTERWWNDWSRGCSYEGPWRDAVVRSLVTLKALTYAPTGGIVAAATTSLPEQIGGVRNWDYRYCWLRDATFTLYALMTAGFMGEAADWRDWLLRAVAGDPSALQIMYGAAGERRLTELELDWLPGYEASRPVRIGNAAVRQFQLDVYGEVLDALHQARRRGLDADAASWALQCALACAVERAWSEPDEGIWEVRGPRRHFTHSKVMAWVALDRAVHGVEHHGRHGPVDRWRQVRQRIHDDVCRHGFDARRGTFTQFYGSAELDASVLMIPLVGFLPPSDPRVRGTVAAIERELMWDGFLRRYSMTPRTEDVDGLPAGEGAFLACTCWLADNYQLQGRTEEARTTFERVLAVRNDVGLLSEEFHPGHRRLLGNFPQAFSHVSLVNTAFNLSRADSPAADRADADGPPRARSAPPRS